MSAVSAPPRVAVVSPGTSSLAWAATGEEVRARPGCGVLVADVAPVVADVWPSARWHGLLRDDLALLAAWGGPVRAARLDWAYPDAETDADVAAAESCARDAGLVARSGAWAPSSRFAALVRRLEPRARQWRCRLPVQMAAADALYGGLQLGLTSACPDVARAPGRELIRALPAGGARGAGWYYADVVSAYPHAALAPLPVIGGVTIETGRRADALLWEIEGRGLGRGWLWSRVGQDLSPGPAYVPRAGEAVRGWYVAAEIEDLVSHGELSELRVVRSLVARQRAPWLARPVLHAYAAKAAAPPGAPRSLLKSALNGYLGRLGTRLRPWVEATPQAAAAAAAQGQGATRIGGLCFLQRPERTAIWCQDTPVLWLALITASVRVRLRQRVREIERAGGVVVWGHTDSVCAVVPDDYTPRESGAALGEWRTLARTVSGGRNAQQQHESSTRGSAGGIPAAGGGEHRGHAA